ncbi:MAG TPA: ATP-binding cassette domain-containing protein [Candidatus Sphingobacterium stercorigallinarum]|nr:ATP-binding cassette domain-containing protein [Candidatus Sphingobacterium stercorigallinarum]
MIEVKNISKSYGDRIILDDISVQFPKGKIVALIGGNGTGKSTLLSIISRLVKKDEGEINLLDQDVYSMTNREFAKRLSILKQSNHPNVRITVRELVSFGRFHHSQGRLKADDELKIDEAIGYMVLQDIQHSYLDELSGGQRQRAFLAMLLVQDTDYILLDEPLNNLDLRHSVEIMRILRNLADNLGKTIIVVVHDINFAVSYADYIVALKDQKVLFYGPTEDVIQEDKLKAIFDLDMRIVSHNNCKYCIYFK